jgi:hypothetical protein
MCCFLRLHYTPCLHQSTNKKQSSNVDPFAWGFLGQKSVFKAVWRLESHPRRLTNGPEKNLRLCLKVLCAIAKSFQICSLRRCQQGYVVKKGRRES